VRLKEQVHKNHAYAHKNPAYAHKNHAYAADAFGYATVLNSYRSMKLALIFNKNLIEN
jgi:hypothetical protein